MCLVFFYWECNIHSQNSLKQQIYMIHVNSFYGIERTITISFYIDIAPNAEFKTQKENSLQIFLTKKNLSGSSTKK